MTRVVAYIDGFNLYHAIDDLGSPHLKWLDLWALCKDLLKNGDTLEAVNYFSAYYTANPKRHRRHERYVAALEAQGVTVHLGIFKRKTVYCQGCKNTSPAWEEKETDVHLAVRMVADAFQDKFDKAILISADSDLLPPVRTIRSCVPGKNIFVVAPPKRMGRARALQAAYEIPKGKVNRNLLPREIICNGGKKIVRPDRYDPPKA